MPETKKDISRKSVNEEEKLCRNETKEEENYVGTKKKKKTKKIRSL